MTSTIKESVKNDEIRIPPPDTKNLSLKEGSVGDNSRTNDGMNLPLQEKTRQDELEELVSLITAENMHNEDFFGRDVGNETE